MYLFFIPETLGNILFFSNEAGFVFFPIIIIVMDNLFVTSGTVLSISQVLIHLIYNNSIR